MASSDERYNTSSGKHYRSFPRWLELVVALILTVVFAFLQNYKVPDTLQNSHETLPQQHQHKTGVSAFFRPHHPELHFIIQNYQARTPERQYELNSCLFRQLANHAIDHIHVFYDSEEDMQKLHSPHPKSTARVWSGRMTFADLVQYANSNLQGHFVGLANLDIFFDDSLELLHRIDMQNEKLAIFLSRYEMDDDGAVTQRTIDEYAAGFSHDAFIWPSPLPNAQEMYSYINYTQGLPGCENRFMWAMEHIAGLKVINPSRSIRSYHLHNSGERSYNQKHRVDTDKTKSRYTYPTTLYAAIEHHVHEPKRQEISD